MTRSVDIVRPAQGPQVYLRQGDTPRQDGGSGGSGGDRTGFGGGGGGNHGRGRGGRGGRSGRSGARRAFAPKNLSRRIYAFFYSKHVAIILILVMAFLTLMGTLLVQSPDGVRGDSDAYRSWLDTVRPRYGGWTDILYTIGFFHIFASPWFKITTIMLTLSIIACTTHRTPSLWQRSKRPHVHPSDAFFARAGLRAEIVMPGTPDQALQRVQGMLRSNRYRVVDDPKDPNGSCYADRFHLAPFATLIAHTAFVIILVGVLVTSTFGFRLNEFPVTVGSTADVGQGTDLAIEVHGFSDSYHPNGQPMDFVSDLVLYDNGRQVARQDVRVNQPMRYDGVVIYQSYFGIAAMLRITDPASGEVLFDGGVPLQYQTDDEKHVFGSVTLPKYGLKYWVISGASGRTDALVAPGQAQIDAVRIGETERTDSGVLDQGASGQIAGLNVTFERERQFTGLSVARDHGALIVWIGSGLMMLGFMLTFLIRQRRLWVRVRPVEGTDAHGRVRSRVVIASTDRTDLGYEHRFRRMIGDFVRRAVKADRSGTAAGTSTVPAATGSRHT